MKLLNEDYLDNVPDMSGPSPFKSDGMWEIKGFINKKVAQDKSEWRPA